MYTVSSKHPVQLINEPVLGCIQYIELVETTQAVAARPCSFRCQLLPISTEVMMNTSIYCFRFVGHALMSFILLFFNSPQKAYNYCTVC